MSVVDIADVKAYLKLPAAAGDDDAKLQAAIDGAEKAIAKRIGPLTPTEKTERIPGGSVLVLRYSPAISLTSITPVGGSALSLTDIYLDAEAGTAAYVWRTPFAAIAYDVVYEVGRSDLDDDLALAIYEMVRHLWTPQRGAMNRGSATPPEPGPGYMWPNRVLELLRPYESPGIA